jgi:hypothetical protein
MTPAPFSAVRITAVIESVEVGIERTRVRLTLRGAFPSQLRSSGARYRGPADAADFELRAESLKAVFTRANLTDLDGLTLTAESPHVQARGFVYLVGQQVSLTVRRKQTVIKPMRSEVDSEDTEKAAKVRKATRSKFTIEIEGKKREVEGFTT